MNHSFVAALSRWPSLFFTAPTIAASSGLAVADDAPEPHTIGHHSKERLARLAGSMRPEANR